MGSGTSAPLPDLPYKDLMCISMKITAIICFYAGKPELDVIRNSIHQFWSSSGGLEYEKAKTLDPEHPDVGQPKCYKFKLHGFPFCVGVTKETSAAAKRMASKILFDLYNLGWKLLVSSDLSRMSDVGTWFFQRHSDQPAQYPFFSIGISGFDKLMIVDCPENLHPAIREVVATTWSNGIQEEQKENGVYTIKFYGNPWGLGDKLQSCTARLVIREIIRTLTRHSFFLYGNTNLKSTADTFFFRFVGAMPEQKYATVSLNRSDRIRLIYTDPLIVQAVEATVRHEWQTRGGVQEVSDESPLCYELKLKGSPWWCYGEEAVASRHLICKIFESLAYNGYYVVSGLDISRRENDKSLLLFQQGEPTQARFMCISLNSIDKVKFIAAPPDVIEAAQRIFALWTMGYIVKPHEELSPGCTYQVKLNGNPWSGMYLGGGYHARALLLGLLGACTDLGWRLVCSADVSATTGSDNKNPLDVHSWYFMFDPSLLTQRQQIHQQHGVLYPSLPVQGATSPPQYYAPPPSYKEATPPSVAPPPSYKEATPPSVAPPPSYKEATGGY